MAFNNPHLLLAWGGVAPGNEIWTNTMRMRYVFPLTPPSQEAVADWLAGGIKDALATFWGVVDNFIGTSTKLSWVKANRVGTDGKYIDSTTNLYTWGTPLGGAAGYEPPNQSSIAVSTTTGVARGRAHIGRFFLPSVGIPLDPVTGTFSSTNATTIATAGANLIDGFNNATDLLTVDQAKCAVMSNLDLGTTRDITGIRVGRVVDTQRRRRNKIAEAGVSVAIP